MDVILPEIELSNEASDQAGPHLFDKVGLQFNNKPRLRGLRCLFSHSFEKKIQQSAATFYVMGHEICHLTSKTRQNPTINIIIAKLLPLGFGPFLHL